MDARDHLLELLRPPAHRGPLIASGALLFTAGIALEEQRLDEQIPNGIHVLIVALAAGLILGLGLQARPEGRPPAAYHSVLLVCGLLLLDGALLELAHVLGSAGGLPAGTLTWTSLVLAAVALYPARRRDSAISAMIAAIALGVAVLAAAEWLFGPLSQTVARWLLLAIATLCVLASLVVRGSSPRHGELLVVTAGLAILAIPLIAGAELLFGGLTPFGGVLGVGAGVLPGFWELVVLTAGCGLIAYGAVDRTPGAAWLGVANLVAFLLAASAGADDTLLWWPLILLALGGGVMVAGLRPRRPLPPEPDAYSVQRPLASRADEDDGEIVVRVRNDEPPDR